MSNKMKRSKEKYLVMGGDSVIGRSLYNELLNRGCEVYYTTRRNTKLLEKSIYFNLKENNINFSPNNVFVCTGISDINFCEQFPKKTWDLNVNLTLDLLKKFYKSGSHITFLSSEMVFNEEIENPDIDSKKQPITQYGKQKSKIENEILLLGKSITIFRMSKVVSINYNFFYEWMENIKKHKVIEAFSNYYLSPISLNYAIKNILKENLNGVVHLTGEKKVSYYDFAKILIDKKLQPNLIKNIEVNFNKKEYLNNSKKKSMNMNLTKKKYNINPQKIKSVVKDLFKEYNNLKNEY